MVGRKRAPDHLNEPLVVLDDYLSHLYICDVRNVETQGVDVVRDQVAEGRVLSDRLGHQDVKFLQDVLESRLDELGLGPKY